MTDTSSTPVGFWASLIEKIRNWQQVSVVGILAIVVLATGWAYDILPKMPAFRSAPVANYATADDLANLASGFALTASRSDVEELKARIAELEKKLAAKKK